MRKTEFAGAFAILLMLAACNEEPAERGKIDAQVTETRMDDIDQIEGTINDEMINVDESNEPAPLAKNDGKKEPGSAQEDTKEDEE